MRSCAQEGFGNAAIILGGVLGPLYNVYMNKAHLSLASSLPHCPLFLLQSLPFSLYRRLFKESKEFSFPALSFVRASRIHIHVLAHAHAHAHVPPPPQKRERWYAENPDSPEAIEDARMKEEVRNRANTPKRTIGGPLGKRRGEKGGGGGEGGKKEGVERVEGGGGRDVSSPRPPPF